MSDRTDRPLPRGGETVVVAIDIGNTAAKWAIATTGGIVGDCDRISLRVDDWPDRITAASRSVAGGRPIEYRVAAVNAPARDRFSEHLRQSGRLHGRSRFGDSDQGDSLRVIDWAEISIKPRLPHPERVGIDRLLAAWQASRLYPQRWLVVVDAGSAITVDCVSPAGDFLGGAILPGLSMQLAALGSGTDALPVIELDDAAESVPPALPIPATDTVTAIRAGVLLGTAAAIDGLVARSWRSVVNRYGAAATVAHDGAAFQMVFSGGDARRLSPWLTQPHLVHAELVVQALLHEFDQAAELSSPGSSR